MDPLNQTLDRRGDRPQSADPEALYAEGMAYYRRRRWHEAKACFEQVKLLQSNSRGIDALLRELDIFLQLESVEAAEAAAPDDGGYEEQALPESEPLQDVFAPAAAPFADTAPTPRSGKSYLMTTLVVLLAALLIVGGTYLVASGAIPLGSNKQSEATLRNLGQAYLIAQQYDKALAVYSKLQAMAPGDREVQNGLENAMDGLYEEALAYEKAGDFAQALARYQSISKINRMYKDVMARIGRLELRLQLDERLQEAMEQLARQAFGEAEKVLLWIRSQDVDYRPGTVSDGLYDVYMGRGNRAIDWVAQELKPAVNVQPAEPQYVVTDEMLARIREALRDFEAATEERRNVQSAQASQEPSEAERAVFLAEHLHEGLERYSDWAWQETILALNEIYVQEADYLSGKVALVLCDAHLHLGSFYYDKGDYQAAVGQFQAMQQIAACDQGLAVRRAQEAGLPLTPPATLTPTLRPTNTPTRTPPPTTTPVPTQSSAPAQPSGGGSSSGTDSSSGGGSSGGGSKPQPKPEPTKPPSKPTPKPRK